MDVSYKAHYQRMRNRLPDWAEAERSPDAFACKREWLPRDRDASILDFGCGWGNQLMALYAAGFRNIEGVERDVGMAEAATDCAGDRCKIHRADGMEFLAGKSARYDLITVNDVIEHIPSSATLPLLRAIHGALLPGGCVVLRTPNMASILSAYSRYLDITHVTGFTEFSIQQALDDAGFIHHKFVPDDWGWRPSTWRPWAPWRGLGIRGATNHMLHRALYWARGMAPMPSLFACNIEVYSEKPR